jgi:hypothetical protein
VAFCCKEEIVTSFEEGLFINLLVRLLQGGASGIIVYWLLEQPFMLGFVAWLEDASAWFTFTDSELKRYVAIALATVLSLGLYMLLVVVGVATLPVGWVSWVDLVLWLGGLSYGTSQVVHARRRLGRGG